MSYAKPLVFPPAQAKTGKAARTKHAIAKHLIELLAERDFDQISAADLAASCGVSRATLYRAYANLGEILWACVFPHLDRAIDAALNANRPGFEAALDRLTGERALLNALVGSSLSQMKAKFVTLVTARTEQRTRRRQTEGLGLIITGAWFSVLEQIARGEPAASSALSDLYTITYVSAFLTPAGVGRLARNVPRTTLPGRFPAAVSVAESLASDDYIISMIDGRRYRTLARHLARYGLTPEDYRHCFDLSDDYRMVAPSYSAKRRALAAQRRGNAETPETVEA